MNCPKARRSCGALHLWSFAVVLVANLLICNADYTLKTKKAIIFNVSTILTPAFARLEGTGSDNSDYVGLIPELLKALKEKISVFGYHIVRATDNEIGHRKQDGNWTGLMGDVRWTNKEHALGAGPILNIDAYKDDFNLSESWATAHLTLVVKSSNVMTLRQALDGDMVVIAVKGSSELEALRQKSATDTELGKLREKIEHSSRLVDSLEKGLAAVRTEANTGVLANSEEARYYLSHGFCDLGAVKTSHVIGDFVFVFPRGDAMVNRFNENLKNMTKDGSLARLRDRELGLPGSCNKGGAMRLENVLAFLIVIATFKSAQIMI